MPTVAITERQELDWMCRKIQAQQQRWRARKARLLAEGYQNQAHQIVHHLDVLLEIEAQLLHLMEQYGRD